MTAFPPPKEFGYMLPFRGLDRPFLSWGIAVAALGALLVNIGFRFPSGVLALYLGLPLPLIVVFLALIYQTSDGKYHL
jgi:hypothetical protein